MRADKALRMLLPEVAPWQLRDAFAARDVKRSEQRITADTQVSAGDVLSVFLPETKAAALDIVSMDDDYVVINKKQGMPVQGQGSVESLLEAQLNAPVYACHRLDVQTGGLVLLARSETALERAEQAFARHEVYKVYQAIVRGTPSPEEATLTGYLLKDAKKATVRILAAPARGALPIETRYRVLESGRDTARLEVTLITGRTHQIRAHLASIGHPVLGDDKYGDHAFNRAHGARRQKLWATQLTLWDGRTFAVSPRF